ncbi:MAG: hypothetical protein HEQ38_04510 [Gemmatimonas sp.]|nr:hypothetical protein [Gemmatimonas sp.]
MIEVWADLARAWDSAQPELLIGLGRRRAGKSFVLARFSEAVGGVYYQATKNTEAKQLMALTRLLGTRFDDPRSPQAARSSNGKTEMGRRDIGPAVPAPGQARLRH